MSIKLFVYGTLKKGKCNHSVLGQAKFLGKGTVVGYDMYSNGYYPYAMFTGSNSRCISGEVYEIDDVSFKRCDQLEGYPRHYDRTMVNVFMDGKIFDKNADITAWIYYTDEERTNTTGLKYLENGVFE